MKINDDLKIKQFKIDNKYLTITISDGRILSVPISWYPRLVAGTIKERNNVRFIGQNTGIHWSDLDEDLSLE